MAKFKNVIKGPVSQLIQGDQVNVTTGDVHAGREVPLSPADARRLQEIVGVEQPEAPGFDDKLKGEVVDALKSIALEQAKALPHKIYAALKQFFPSYVQPLLP